MWEHAAALYHQYMFPQTVSDTTSVSALSPKHFLKAVTVDGDGLLQQQKTFEEADKELKMSKFQSNIHGTCQKRLRRGVSTGPLEVSNSGALTPVG